MYKIKFKLSRVIVVALLTSAIHADVKSIQPNIVHILIDDLGWQDVASHKIEGKPVYETPNIDKLTVDGMRFTQAYSPAPTCAPSRVSYLRGQFPGTTGVYHVLGGRVPRRLDDNRKYVAPYYPYGLAVEEPTIAKVLKSAGYRTGHVGKWHAGGKFAGYPFPVHQGFDFSYTEANSNRYYNDPDILNMTPKKQHIFSGSWTPMKPNRIKGFATAKESDPYQLDEEERPFDLPLNLALGFMNKHKADPFFLNFCPYYVHGPLGTRDLKRFKLYLEKMGIPFPQDAESLSKLKSGHSNPYYASMVDTVDWMVGQVVDYLEKTDDPRNPGKKLIENTYIMISSDNGGWLGYSHESVTDNSPLRAGKLNAYEGGIRIPFVIRGPDIKKSSVSKTVISLIDMFPTYMAMAGVSQDGSLDLEGANILPILQGKTDKAYLLNGQERESLYFHFPWASHMCAGIRKGPWKLLKNYDLKDGKEFIELFQISDKEGNALDISESVNLAKSRPEVVKSLLTDLEQYQKSVGARAPFKNAISWDDKQIINQIPAMINQGSDRDVVWMTYETGEGKAKIVNAKLLYTLNPPLLDQTGGKREEWFMTHATMTNGKLEARMPPGATHAVFYCRDENGFMVRSESKFPSMIEVNRDTPDSLILKYGYAYRPGLFALIELAEEAEKNATINKIEVGELKVAIKNAKEVYKNEGSSEVNYCDVIRSLRRAIRSQPGVSQANQWHINRFPLDSKF